MSLIALIVTLAVVGLIVWLVVTYIPMPEPFKTVIVAVAVLVLLLWVLQQLGVVGPSVSFR